VVDRGQGSHRASYRAQDDPTASSHLVQHVSGAEVANTEVEKLGRFLHSARVY
jgi:hypothetical protein